MKLKTCMLMENRCYQAATKIKSSKPVGIVVHSTGCNNPYLRRYVQPTNKTVNYAEVMADIGINSYGNHWNRQEAKVCVHAMIGKNAAGEVETYQLLPENICCWGVGQGPKGSYNYNPTAHLQFEIEEDNLKDREYFNTVMREAQELCAYWCKKYKLSAGKICSHKECHDRGYGSNHGDPDHWLKKFGKNMDWFRACVQNILDGEEPEPQYVPTVLEWQEAALADGFDFPKYGEDGKWGTECEAVAKKAIVKKQLIGYKYPYLTAIVQKVVNVVPDGKCGKCTDAAIREYQKNNGLAVDGAVGLNTWKKILKV